MSNIFKNAYFGKAYKTRDGRKFVYLGNVESLFGHDSAIQGMIEDNDILTYYNLEGKSLYCEYKGSAINAFDIDFDQVNCEEDCETDIVSEWQEEINEEELDEIAWDIFDKQWKSTHCEKENDFIVGFMKWFRLGFIAGYGYRKAKEL